ncbi:chromate efflux transporter [Peijinzhouia sedimentorum]
MIRKVRYLIFLKDILILSVTCFGGAQAHLAFFLERLVKKRAYLTEDDLMELTALTSILPGPASTQILTSLGFKIGGPNLAYLTLLVWIMPGVILMTTLGIFINYLNANNLDLSFTKFIQPMAVGFVSYAALMISTKLVKSKDALAIMVVSIIVTYYVSSPYLFPVLLLVAGSLTAFKYERQSIEEKEKINVKWANFLLWGGVFIAAAVTGAITQWKGMLIFENFYRNGSLIFGGGQVLIPLIYTEFVEFKAFLSSEEFLIGYGFAQGLPGPTFAFSAFIGALSMREMGIGGEIGGGILASLGIFLPGTFLIFFVIRIWEGLKKYRVVRASLEGINAASAGMVAATAIILFDPIDGNFINIMVIVGTFCMLYFTKIPAPLIILVGLIAGVIF